MPMMPQMGAAGVPGAGNIDISQLMQQISRFLPALGAFIPGMQRENSAEHIRRLGAAYSGVLNPYFVAPRRAAFRTGAQQGQRLKAATRDKLGASGVSDTGVGDVAEGLAQSSASNRASSAVGQIDMAQAELIAQLIQGSLGESMRALYQPGTKLQNFGKGFGMARATSSGGMPFGQMSLEQIMDLLTAAGS